MKKIWFILLLLSYTLLQKCETPSQAGNTSDLENAKVVGIILDETGQPVVNAQVTLSIKTENILTFRNRERKEFDTSVFTNSIGKYEFFVPDSGLFYITVEKYKRLLSVIDSIYISNNMLIEIPTDTVKAPGSIQGVAYLEDTAGVSNKGIYIVCKELSIKKKVIQHGEDFSFISLPQGYYSIEFHAKSPLFVKQSSKIKIHPNEIATLDPVILQKITNYISSSNVFNDSFIGLSDLPNTITPLYTFKKTPLYAQAKCITIPDKDYLKITTEIIGDSVFIIHNDNFNNGREIGIYLLIKFLDGETINFDFASLPSRRFTVKE